MAMLVIARGYRNLWTIPGPCGLWDSSPKLIHPQGQGQPRVLSKADQLSHVVNLCKSVCRIWGWLGSFILGLFASPKLVPSVGAPWAQAAQLLGFPAHISRISGPAPIMTDSKKQCKISCHLTMSGCSTLNFACFEAISWSCYNVSGPTLVALTSSSTIWSFKTKLVIEFQWMPPINAARNGCHVFLKTIEKPNIILLITIPPLISSCIPSHYAIVLMSSSLAIRPQGPQGLRLWWHWGSFCLSWTANLSETRGSKLDCWGPWKLGELTKLSMDWFKGKFTGKPHI